MGTMKGRRQNVGKPGGKIHSRRHRAQGTEIPGKTWDRAQAHTQENPGKRLDSLRESPREDKEDEQRPGAAAALWPARSLPLREWTIALHFSKPCTVTKNSY